ncbi:MAG: hypothetical protein V4693_24315 [Pseudomonadota bacterium]
MERTNVVAGNQVGQTDRADLRESRAARLEQQAATVRLEQEGTSLQDLKAQRECRELELAEITASEVATLIAADPELKASLQDAFVKLGLPAAWHNVEQLDRTIGAVPCWIGSTAKAAWPGRSGRVSRPQPLRRESRGGRELPARQAVLVRPGETLLALPEF